MSLIILTKSPAFDAFSPETYKKLIRKVFKKNRGPQAVTASVMRGLEAVNYKYKINPNIREIEPTDTIWVNESVEALRWAINFKQENKGARLIAGPNLVVTPDDNDGIIFNENIDIILQPSLWTKKLYETYSNENASKIHIWPAGVVDPYEKNTAPKKENFMIVYQKNAPQEIFETIIRTLNERSIPFLVIKYGSFKHENFLSLLNKACGMIYLSSSESQGLALQEAWMRDVPTLVWDRGFWIHKGIKFEHELISSPYLTSDTGIGFKGKEDAAQKLDLFMEKLHDFKARTYCVENLSDKVTTAKYIDIIRS
ncbi:MAG: hypothetical protein V4664_00180 [Patescibacteria group bacterium]